METTKDKKPDLKKPKYWTQKKQMERQAEKIKTDFALFNISRKFKK
jgi:hypothetical protein